MLDDLIKEALQEAVRRAGSQTALAQRTGMNQSRISDYCRGRFAVENMTIGVLTRLFPKMLIDFFGEGNTKNISKHKTIEVGGRVSGNIVQNGRLRDVAAPPAGPIDAVDLKELERKIRKSNTLTPEERLKFLDFLDEEL